MAAGIIKFDRNTEPMRTLFTALQNIRKGVEDLGHVRAIMIQSCDGSTDTAANFDLLAAAGVFVAGDYADANAAALASFAEIDSLYFKLTTNSSISDMAAALAQACAKHGV